MRGWIISIMGLLFGFIGAANAQSSLQSIACGTSYTVKDGDFLSTISQLAYGNAGAYNLLVNSNSDVIGSDHNTIKAGLVLQIPCFDDDTIKQAIQLTNASASANTGNSAYRFIVNNQWAPFLDDKSESGGMLTEIVRRALEASDEKPDHKMRFFSDSKSIVNPLLTDHAYDMSIGYTKPKCEAFDLLGEESQFRCNTLDWSEPLYETVVGYHSLTETPLLNQHAELFGKRICRPDSYATSDMDIAGIKEPAVTMVRPEKPLDCLEALIEGEADFAALTIDVAQGIASEIGIESRIKVHEPLNHVSTVHVVIAKSHPKAQNMMQVVDNGLAKLKDSGDWFTIVKNHMIEHRNKSR